MSEIVGHTAQLASLQRLVASGRLPTTAMFAGPAGIGKRLVANRIARSLLCERAIFGGCDECHACRLVLHGNHPDLKTIECADADAANVAAIRELLYSLNLKSFSGSKRIVIFNDAEAMSVQTANILLKQFEEPRPDTYFLLISANPAELPPTLISRCQITFFDRLSDEAVKRYIERHPEISTADGERLNVAELVTLADGSLSNIELVREHLPLWHDLRDKLTRIRNGDTYLAHELSQALGKKKDGISAALLLMRIRAREELHHATTDPDRSAWATFLTNILSAEHAIAERNLSPVYVLHFILLHLAGRPELGSFTTLTNGGTLLSSVIS